MDTGRQDEHYMGYNLPDGAQRTKCQAASRVGTNLLRSGTDLPNLIGRLEDKRQEEVGQRGRQNVTHTGKTW